VLLVCLSVCLSVCLPVCLSVCPVIAPQDFRTLDELHEALVGLRAAHRQATEAKELRGSKLLQLQGTLDALHQERERVRFPSDGARAPPDTSLVLSLHPALPPSHVEVDVRRLYLTMLLGAGAVPFNSREILG
jgi:hypothetical protein